MPTIQGDVRSACFEYAEHCYDHLRRTIKQQNHKRLWSNAEFAQSMCEPVCTLVQLRVGQSSVFVDKSVVIGREECLLFEDFVEGLVINCDRRSWLIEVNQQTLSIFIAQQRVTTNSRFRIVSRAPHQDFKAGGKSLHTLFIEHSRVIPQLNSERIVPGMAEKTNFEALKQRPLLDD